MPYLINLSSPEIWVGQSGFSQPHIQGGGGGVALSSFTDTFNSADKGTEMVLSNGDLTATRTAVAAEWETAHSTEVRDSSLGGHFYFEVTMDSFNTINWMAGITVDGDGTDIAFVGTGANAWGVRKDGTIFNNGSSPGGGMPTLASVTDYYGFSVNFDTSTLQVAANGGSFSTVTSSLSTSSMYHIGFASFTATNAATINCGATAFNETLPSGAVAWNN